MNALPDWMASAGEAECVCGHGAHREELLMICDRCDEVESACTCEPEEGADA